MTIGDAITGALPRLRSQAESMMTGTCTIRRPGDPVFDSATGTYTTSKPTVYSGKCRVRTRSVNFLRDRTAESGEVQETIWPYIVSVPLTFAPQVLDEITIDTDPDAALVGVVMRVRIANLATDATARKMDCEEIA